MQSRSIAAAALVRRLGAWRKSEVGTPAYQGLARALGLLVLDGRLPLGVRLPGERSLAEALEISRTTVGAAFALLQQEGFIEKRQRSSALTALPASAQRSSALLTADRASGVIDFATATMPAGPQVHAAYSSALAALPAYLPGHGYEPLGCAEFQESVAEYYRRQGLPTSPDCIMATHGAQNGLALLLRLLIRPRDPVLIEHPTYPNAIDAIFEAGCTPVPLPLTDDGWDIDAVVAAISRRAPPLAYFIADHHNPTAHLMLPESRSLLVAATAGKNTVLVFDETLRDLWLGDSPDFGEPQDGPHVVRLGSMSKSFWGGLRIGWIRAHPDLIGKLVKARASLDLGVPLLEQLAAAALLLAGEGALAERRVLLRERLHLLSALVSEKLPDWRFLRPEGGLSLWVNMPKPVANALAAGCEARGLKLAAGPRFGIGGAFERFLRLPFTLPDEQISQAIADLVAVYQDGLPLMRGRQEERKLKRADLY